MVLRLVLQALEEMESFYSQQRKILKGLLNKSGAVIQQLSAKQAAAQVHLIQTATTLLSLSLSNITLNGTGFVLWVMPKHTPHSLRLDRVGFRHKSCDLMFTKGDTDEIVPSL